MFEEKQPELNEIQSAKNAPDIPQKRRRKSFQELTLADNFMFCQVMQEKAICTEFLNSLLGIQVAELEYMEPQKEFADAYGFRGLRLDIFVKDTEGNAYNIEMQQKNKPGLKQRIRLYSSAIDRKLLEEGGDYNELPNNIVIMICNFDLFEKGLAKYRVHRVVDERASGVFQDYQDGSEIFYLNAKFKINNVSDNIVDFLNLVEGQSAVTDFGQNVTQQIADVKSDKKKEAVYMTVQEWADEQIAEAKAEARIEGREEGRAEGRAEGTLEGKEAALLSVVRNMKNYGATMETIAQAIGKTVEETAEMAKKIPQT